MSYVDDVERFSAAWMKPHCEANVKQMTPLANRDTVNTHFVEYSTRQKPKQILYMI